MPASPSAIRDVVGSQPTVAQSIAAFLRGVTAAIYAGEVSAMALADDISAQGPAWAAAFTQNTPHAADVVALEMDTTKLPSGMNEAFPPLSTRAQQLAEMDALKKAAAEREAADKKAADDKAAADKKAAEQAAKAAAAQREAQYQAAQNQPQREA